MTDEELIRERGHIEGHLAERLALHISEHYGPISAGSDEFRPLYLEEAKALGYDDDDPVVLIRRESDGVVFEVGVDVTARRVPTEAGAVSGELRDLGFGDSVRRLRAEQGLSLTQLGWKAGRDWSTIWQIEKGRSGARLDTALAIAGALGATVESMITAPPAAAGPEVRGGGGFGAAVRRRRQDRGWSMPDLAARSGLPVTTLSRIELGHVTPTLLVASLLASPLEASITALAGTGGGRG